MEEGMGGGFKWFLMNKIVQKYETVPKSYYPKQ